MANALALEELRKEGFIPWSVDRRLGSFVTCDLFLCGDVLGHWPNCDRRDRIVNACGEDVQPHFDKYLKGYSVERMRKNKETGKMEIVQKEFPPNPYLPTLLLKYDFYVYSFVLRSAKNSEGKRLKSKIYVCRKWKAIISPEGHISFVKEDKNEESDN